MKTYGALPKVLNSTVPKSKNKVLIVVYHERYFFLTLLCDSGRKHERTLTIVTKYTE